MSPLLFAALSLLAAPAARSAPDWVEGESTEWPRPLYLTGVGSADDRTTAEERARAELARIFSSRVVSVSSTSASESSTTRGGSSAVSSERRVADDTVVTAEKELAGVEVVAWWIDPASRRHFALAVLERKKAAAAIRSQLEDLAARARPLRQQLAAADRAAAGLAAIRLMRLARLREPLVADLRIVSPSANPGDGFAAARAEAEAALGRLAVAVVATGEGAPGVEAAVIEGLAGLGIRARPGVDPAAADLVAEARADLLETYERGDGWFWARASAAARIRNPRTGEAVLDAQEVVREAATRPEEARRRALRAAAAAVRERLAQDLLGGNG